MARTYRAMKVNRSAVWIAGWMVVLTVVLMLPGQVRAQGRDARDTELINTAKRQMETEMAPLRRQAQQNKDLLVLPGLVADRKARTVQVWGATPAIPHTEPVEFLLIHESSGKDYEALAIAFATAHDIDKALRFIGMKPGRGVDFQKLHFWPKGERVLMTMHWQQPGQRDEDPATDTSARVEDLIFDVREEKSLPRTGLVYTGSYWLENPENHERHFAADRSIKSFASLYNEPTTLLDVPRLALQGDVYGFYRLNPQHRFKRYQPVRFTLEPEHKDDKTRVRELTLHIKPAPGTQADTVQALHFEVMEGEKRLNREHTIASAVTAMVNIARNNQDPFVTLHVDDGVRISGARQALELLSSIHSERGIRLEAPLEGHLFFEAFLPDEKFRERANRVFQPWELHLVEVEGRIRATLIDIHEDFNAPRDQRLTEKPSGVADGAEAARMMRQRDENRPRTLFVFAPPSMTYGQLHQWIRPILPSHQTIFVYLPKVPRE